MLFFSADSYIAFNTDQYTGAIRIEIRSPITPVMVAPINPIVVNMVENNTIIQKVVPFVSANDFFTIPPRFLFLICNPDKVYKFRAKVYHYTYQCEKNKQYGRDYSDQYFYCRCCVYSYY